MAQGRQLFTLRCLEWAVKNRKSVILPGSQVWGRRPYPAAFMIHLSGIVLLKLFNLGMYVYKKEGIDEP